MGELEELEHEKVAAQKMVDLLRPAYFKVMKDESQQIRMTTVQSKYIKKSDSENVKPGSLADIASKMKDEEMEQREREEKERKEAQRRLKEREEEIKETEEAKLKA